MRRLWRSVIVCAIRDAFYQEVRYDHKNKTLKPVSKEERIAKAEAREWLFSDDPIIRAEFNEVCVMAELCPERMLRNIRRLKNKFGRGPVTLNEIRRYVNNPLFFH